MKNSHTPLRYSLAFLDLSAWLLASSLAYWVRIGSGLIPYYAVANPVDYLELYVCSAPLLLIIFYSMHLYDTFNLFYGTSEYISVLKGSTFLVMGTVLISFAGHGAPPSRGWLAASLVLSMFILCLNRFMFRRLFKGYLKSGNFFEKALILGANEDAKAIALRLENTRKVEVVGFLDDFSPTGTEVYSGKRILGPPSHWAAIANKLGASTAILVPDAISWETKKELFASAPFEGGVELQIAAGLSDLYLASMRVGFLGNVPLLRFKPGYVTGLDATLKNLTDYFLGVSILTLTFPVFAVISLLLLVSGGWPIFHTEEVLGRNGRVFRCYKFRTGLVAQSGRCIRLLSALSKTCNQKTGALQRFLFRSGLDKLPQFLNVLSGKMSVVGPRSLSPESAKLYGHRLHVVLSVKPGVTGNWALNQAEGVDGEISMALHYVQNWYIWTDISIFLQTLLEMIRTRLRTRLADRSACCEAAATMQHSQHPPAASRLDTKKQEIRADE